MASQINMKKYFWVGFRLVCFITLIAVIYIDFFSSNKPVHWSIIRDVFVILLAIIAIYYRNKADRES
jgi:hypothetical protein